MSEISEDQYFRKFISPANPIITKKVSLDQETKVVIKPLVFNHELISNLNQLQNNSAENENSQGTQFMDRLTLLNGYSQKSLVFKKYDNNDYRTRNNKAYYSSVFTELDEFPSSNQFSAEANGVRFSSSEESMNLFSVFQTGTNQFDLILQNDLNTSGYTQWFYFSVFNKLKSQTIRINIVNLYKSKSLYNLGMKPLVWSKKAGKGWQRGGSNVIYSDNQINIEHSNKFYHTLSFQHTFLQENNQTQFAHCYPYPYSTLKQKLKALQKYPKIKIRYIGMTALKKNIPIIQFFQNDSNQNKKAIIFMSRQHPGETVGSLIMDEIINELTKISVENEFLLYRFNIYVIPMVNIDGVLLGNYRGNAHGLDLNRCWDKQNYFKLPQVICIKKEIRKIQKKYPIQLILDLHGHSRKMGSFFYGNPFGKNTGLFAYIASNMSQCVSFEDSTFSKQKSEKITTARIVLGNIIKDTGCFYTYETSFYGWQSNGKRFHFSLQNYQQLGRNLLNATYKTFLEIGKEQKSLKQSLFLKQIRKQFDLIQKIQNGPDSGSDSEAEQTTIQQIQIKKTEQSKKEKQQQKLFLRPYLFQESKKATEIKNKASLSIQAGDGIIRPSDLQEEAPIESLNSAVIEAGRRFNRKILKNNGSISQKYSLHVGFQKSEDSPIKRSDQDSSKRKNYLLEKLRIFGQTYVDPTYNDKNKETQTNFPLNIMCLSKKSTNKEQDSPAKSTQFRKRKNRNRSLIIKLDNREKLAMADIVKVNKLEYKKIQRNSLIEASRKESNKPNILPNIN